MKRNSVKIKSIINYLSSIITWAIFVILIACAACLVYYYISLQIYARKGESFAPPYSIYTIVSPSMTPKIKVYDVIINTKVDKPEDIKVGDIITFKSSSSFTYGMTITHRVKDIQIVNGEYQFTTQGDNNLSKDSAPALYRNVIGKAVIKIPQLGRIQFFVASKFGWLLVVILPAVYVIIKDVSKLIRISKVKKNAEEANRRLLEEDKNNGIIENERNNTDES
ncbi:MAG: signal peptidase I [Firmicutes bacterium]|nr:signal peptidase I [Bacillota bacterium]